MSVQPDAAKPRPSILLVEDSLEMRWPISHWLESQDFDVTVACDGAEAWNVLNQKRTRPIILTDHQMPELTGANLLRRVCEEGIPAMGAILMSGDPRIVEEAEAIEPELTALGIPFFLLPKPFTEDALAKCLWNICFSPPLFVSGSTK